ncbi:hypothetical protein niasHT_008564 [Heterodera trifolii]|uniref:Uncharacterized protein n=1 Tax=Heterodera trifolii TaxID=157864 RepID=A0ABD2MBB9_9BILA
MNSSSKNAEKEGGQKQLRERHLHRSNVEEAEAEAIDVEAEAEVEEELLPALLKPAFQVEQFTLEVNQQPAYTCHAVEMQPFLQTFFDLHLEVMDRRDTRAGCLRTFEMTVGDFEPMPSEEVPAAMQEFTRWFNQHLLAESMTAGEFAARAHHTLVKKLKNNK